MHRITSRLADGLLAVAALPPGQAHLLPIHSARVMSKTVVAGPTKRGARCVVVIGRAFDAHPTLMGSYDDDGQGNCRWMVPRVTLLHVSDPCILALVIERVPFIGGQDYAREGGLLDQLILDCERKVEE